MKVVVSVAPIAFLILGSTIGTAYPNIIKSINNFLQTILGLSTQNSYAAVLTFIVSFIIFIGISRILTSKAIIKQG